jgi:hypothetical protein
MSTAIFTPGETKWGHPPDEELTVVAAPVDDPVQFRTVSRASWPHLPEATTAAAWVETIMDEFVELLRDNPKVWAVYAAQDPSGITVWTYVDSTDRNDRSLVYEAEWQLLNMYPEVGFDFNTALVPAGDEQFEEGEKVYLYRR